jgi:hypothetical protein
MTDPRAEWAEQLSVSADAAPDEAVAAFLRALPAEDFLPPAEKVAAVNALGGTGGPVGPDYTTEQFLRSELDAFAVRYWTMEPAERLTAWAELSRRGAPAARLRDLEPGLDVSVDPLPDPDADELAGVFRSLFVLPPRDRAIRRNTWLAEHAMDAFRWRGALSVLLREARAVPALDPRFAAALSPDFNLAAFNSGATVAPAARGTAGVADFRRRMQEYEDTEPAPEPGYEAADRRRAKTILGGTFVVLVLFCCLSGLVKNANRGGSRDTPTSAPKANAPTSTPETPSLFPATRDFTIAEVAEFERYERETTPGRAEPLNYRAWRLVGRPSGKDAPLGFRVTFDLATIQACLAYDRMENGTKPLLYDAWVRAGKPSSAGTYTVSRTIPETKP